LTDLPAAILNLAAATARSPPISAIKVHYLAAWHISSAKLYFLPSNLELLIYLVKLQIR
jgi:hypothetical protein